MASCKGLLARPVGAVRGHRLGAIALALTVAITGGLYAAGTRQDANTITLYSGRGESLVAPLIEEFQRETGITVAVRYGGTAELAVLLQEEGARSPADLFWAQDAGALGAVANGGLLRGLPDDVFAGVPTIYRGGRGLWIATSGRARVLAYSPTAVTNDGFPTSVFDLTDPQYRGRVGWAPTNGSFQSFITAMRVEHGDDSTQRWVEAMIANDVQSYRSNTAIVEAIAAGEVAFGITNNYYLLRFQASDPDFPVAQRFFAPGDTGNLVNVAGVGVIAGSANTENAERFVRFLLDRSAQQYFTSEVYEYPITDAVAQNPRLESFARLLEVSPQIELDRLEDLEGTLALLRRAGAL
ncbi:MAG: iron ABC transporter substrate-binding protein [Spirochaetaceae bacterium]|nr:MAG: iron ABC transporter substrate-binding protein [Spirochaetaceae bacterium]